MSKKRCSWARDLDNHVMIKYHDEEYGRMINDNNKLFELFCLELLQAGLSWNIVLQKRKAFNAAFHNFEITQVAQMQLDDQLLQNKELIRNKAKLAAIINNAQVIIEQNIDLKNYVVEMYDAFKDDYSSGARQYKKDGFKFVGPSIIASLYAALGLFEAHETECFLYNREREGD
jgi:DNA-3-methyladenine glycosylase I